MNLGFKIQIYILVSIYTSIYILGYFDTRDI